MKTPICEVCLNSDILCGGCQGKLQRGELTQAEVSVSKFLFKLSDGVKSLKDASVLKIIDGDVLVIVAAKGDAPRIVGKAGAIVKALAKEFGKSIRVIEESDFKTFVQNIVSPLPVNGVNVLYTPEGEVLRVRLPVMQKNRLLISGESFSSIISIVFGKKAELVFED